MRVGKATATSLIGLSLFGAGANQAWALDERDDYIAADAGPLSGSLVHAEAKGGYIALGAQQRVEATPRPPYRGGSLSDWLNSNGRHEELRR